MDVLRTGCSVLGTMEIENSEGDPLHIADRLTACFGSILLYWHHFHTTGKQIDVETNDETTAGHSSASAARKTTGRTETQSR